MANALCQEKLNESSLIRIFWPRERCNLLRDDVVFVDSPGVDVSKNLDDWIDNHCVNADVFVLVLNAESTMTLTVSARLNTILIPITPDTCALLLGKVILSHRFAASFEAEYICPEQSMGRFGPRARFSRVGK